MRLTITLILMLFLAGSCDEKILTGNVDCDECYLEAPGFYDLIIEVTVNNKYPEVPFIIYNGDAEDNDVVAVDTALYSPVYVYVPVNKKYSVRAEYKADNETIYALDGTNLKVLSVTDACDGKCYVVENDEMDARLKKEFP
jgi:hypothetical protein